MEISSPATIVDLAEKLPGNCLRLVAHVQSSTDQVHDPVQRDVCFAVGPEGGFTDEEIAQFVDIGWTPIQLGDRILRIETAAVAVASWWGISIWLSR